MPFDDYEVGKCTPPKHSRFKKGQSGNPKGRPRGSFSLRTMLERALGAKASFTEKGRQKFKKKWEIAMMQLANRAAKGDLAAIRLVFTYRSLLESASEADLQELAVREQQRDFDYMTPEEMEAQRRELDEMEEALKRNAARKEEIRRRKNKT